MGLVAILVGGIGRAIAWLTPEPEGELKPIPVRVRERRPRRD
jgi:hypothetical protein